MFLEKVAIVAASEYSAVGADGCGNLNHKKLFGAVLTVHFGLKGLQKRQG